MAYTVEIGGPSYQMTVDARHAQSMAALACEFVMRQWNVVMHYEHACPVEMARNSIFKSALEEPKIDVLIQCDSDVYFDKAFADELHWASFELLRVGAPILVVPVPQRNGDSNIVLDGLALKRLNGRMSMGRTFNECWGAGLGLALFNLHWYRRAWPDGPHFRSDWIATEGDWSKPLRFISEDIWHTSRLRRHGGKCQWAPLMATYHAARGGDVLSSEVPR